MTGHNSVRGRTVTGESLSQTRMRRGKRSGLRGEKEKYGRGIKEMTNNWVGDDMETPKGVRGKRKDNNKESKEKGKKKQCQLQ